MPRKLATMVRNWTLSKRILLCRNANRSRSHRDPMPAPMVVAAVPREGAGAARRATWDTGDMCGLAGEIRLDGRQADVGAVERMAATMADRGPDDSGAWASGRIALAHRT